MSDTISLPFHRKYRPIKLIDYIGNDKVKKRTLSALNSNTKPQVILLQGASGCGKTSFARLIAKEYRCENRDPEKGACGVCQSCKEMENYISTGDADSLMDLKEINISDNSGKNDISPIVSDAMLPSMSFGWKIYILDECHMATTQAQNMLLKVVEEPPEKVLFIFCTTDPDKMLPTLLNRCQLLLSIRKPNIQDLSMLLRDICVKEGVDYDKKGLSLISSRSELTIRKALINLEDILNTYHSATYENVLESMEEMADTVMFQFYKYLLNRDIMGYVTLLFEIKTKMDLGVFITSLKDFTARGIYILNGVSVGGLTDIELKTYRDLFNKFSVVELATLLNNLDSMRSDDAESKLLLMGYKGLNNVTNDSTTDEASIDIDETTIADEVRANNKNTKKLQEDMINNADSRVESLTNTVTQADLLKVFGGVMIKPEE